MFIKGSNKYSIPNLVQFKAESIFKADARKDFGMLIEPYMDTEYTYYGLQNGKRYIHKKLISYVWDVYNDQRIGGANSHRLYISPISNSTEPLLDRLEQFRTILDEDFPTLLEESDNFFVFDIVISVPYPEYSNYLNLIFSAIRTNKMRWHNFSTPHISMVHLDDLDLLVLNKDTYNFVDLKFINFEERVYTFPLIYTKDPVSRIITIYSDSVVSTYIKQEVIDMVKTGDLTKFKYKIIWNNITYKGESYG